MAAEAKRRKPADTRNGSAIAVVPERKKRRREAGGLLNFSSIKIEAYFVAGAVFQIVAASIEKDPINFSSI